MTFEKALCFDDVLLMPQYFEKKSRKEVDLSTEISGIKLKIPIISANMPSVTGASMALELSKVGGLGILDRMIPLEEQIEEIIKFNKYTNSSFDFPCDPVIGASIGINKRDLQNARALIQQGAKIICIDVAHADQRQTKEIYFLFRERYPDFPLIIGNYATPFNLEYFRDDSKLTFKVGIGGGSHCTTRIETGCGLPTFASGQLFSEESFNFILDGGIKSSGDIVKSLALGAKAVMLGSLLSGHKECPGNVIKQNGKLYKIYRGNASFGVKASIGNVEHVEGEESLVPYKGEVAKTLAKLEQGIRSGMSYCGSESLSQLLLKCKFVEISSGGHHESKPHGAI